MAWILGTDSRFGFGYRLGEHADFQVVYELGPQKYTRKLGSQDSDSNNNKRNADYDESYKASPNSAGAKWLSNWSNGMKSQKKRMPQKDVQANGVQEVKTMPYINESALKQLQLLYGKPQTASEDIGVIPAEQLEQDFKIVMEEPKVDKAKITADLMDVDLD